MKPINWKAAAAAILMLATTGCMGVFTGSDSTAPAARRSTPIPNHYIVQYHEHVEQETRRMHESEVHSVSKAFGDGQHRGVIRTFNIGRFAGYHAEFTPEHAEALRKLEIVSNYRSATNDPASGLDVLTNSHPHHQQIKTIEPDMTVHISSPVPQDLNIHRPDLGCSGSICLDHGGRDKNPPPPSVDTHVQMFNMTAFSWGQARISNFNPVQQSGDESLNYPHALSTQAYKTIVYVIDSGVRVTHDEFHEEIPPPSSPPTGSPHIGGNPHSIRLSRVLWGHNWNNTIDEDENGHGTHVAGTIGGRRFGIAPRTQIVALKALGSDGGGALSNVILAIEWAANHTRANNASGLSVINMSLGCENSTSEAMDSAIRAAIEHAGITVVVAAGNEDSDSRTGSPANSPGVISVASIGRDNHRSSFSDWGRAVTLFAPGEGIISAGFADDSANATMSGTSMAAPHVAGLAAYFMGLYGPHTPECMKKRLLACAIAGQVIDPRGSPNLIAYNGNSYPSSGGRKGLGNQKVRLSCGDSRWTRPDCGEN